MSVICTLCNEENADTAAFCVNCGAGISSGNADVCCADSSSNETGIPQSVITLHEMRCNKDIVINQDGIIGRLGNIEREFFASSDYVSEYHCKIYHEAGRWYVEHLSFTNPTAINSVNIEHDVPNVIRDGDRLRIADLYFKVSVSIINNAESPAQSVQGDENVETSIADESREIWEIICPVCGKVYLDENGLRDKFRVGECTGDCKYDEFDKFAISKALPRKK